MDLKICGLCQLDDVEFCLVQGIPYLGFILVENSKRFITSAEVFQIWTKARSKGKSKPVFVVADEDASVLTKLAENWYSYFHEKPCVQLHGDESPEFVSSLIASGTFDEVWKALRVDANPTFILEKKYVDADLILLDGQSPGSGQPFDWTLLAPAAPQRRWGLAGGITAENIQEAIACKPALIDVSSGSESTVRRKDQKKITYLWQAVRTR